MVTGMGLIKAAGTRFELATPCAAPHHAYAPTAWQHEPAF